MPFNIEIICVGADLYADAGAAARLLNRAQSTLPAQEFVFGLPPQEWRMRFVSYTLQEYSSEEVFKKLAEYRDLARGDRRHIIAIVPGKLTSGSAGNLFGVRDSTDGSVVVTVEGFERYITSRTAYLAFFFLRFAMSFVHPERLSHEDSPNCAFHRRTERPKLIDALYDGMVCDTCVRALSEKWNTGISNAFRTMLAVLKSELPSRDDKQVRSRVALLMKGGGVKGLALIGALQELEKRYEFDAYAGTSAGSIVAALAALGSTPDALEATLRRTDFQSFRDGHWLFKWWTLIRYQHAHPGTAFEAWFWNEVRDAYNERTNKAQPPRVVDSPRHLVIFATSASRGLITFDSEDQASERNRLVTFAVRASMSIPGFFKPPLLDGQPVFDGGLLANFPVREWIDRYPDRPFLGLYLGPHTLDPTRSQPVATSVVEIATTRDDYAIIDKYRDSVVIIDPSPIGTTDFGLSKEEADFLVLEGRASALEHMARVFKDASIIEEAKARRAEANTAREKAVGARKKARNRKNLKRAMGVVAVAGLAFGWTKGCGDPLPVWCGERIEMPLRVVAHVGQRGDLSANQDAWAGNPGSGDSIHAIGIAWRNGFPDYVPNLSLEYRCHVGKLGWQQWRTAGRIDSQEGPPHPGDAAWCIDARLDARVEAMEARLSGANAEFFELQYSCSPAGSDPESCGSPGLGTALDAVRLAVVSKGSCRRRD